MVTDIFDAAEATHKPADTVADALTQHVVAGHDELMRMPDATAARLIA